MSHWRIIGSRPRQGRDRKPGRVRVRGASARCRRRVPELGRLGPSRPGGRHQRSGQAVGQGVPGARRSGACLGFDGLLPGDHSGQENARDAFREIHRFVAHPEQPGPGNPEAREA